MPEHRSGEKPQVQKGDLVAPERQQPRGCARSDAPGEGPAFERPHQQPERDRPPGKAHHLADVLDPPCRRGTEREGKGGDRPAQRVPAPIPEQQQDRRSAEPQHAEDRGVGGSEARVGVEQRQQEVRC
jgi:hypothetical protein